MKLTEEAVSKSFGGDLNDTCRKFLEETNFNYEVIEGQDRDSYIMSNLDMIQSDTQVIAAPERTEVWEKGWKENLDDFKKTQDISAVLPKFIRPNHILRFNQEYIKTENEYFERDFVKLFQMWFFDKYMSDYDHIYEFGCGSGFNLATIAEMFPDKSLVGTDFAHSSVDLINALGS